MRTVQLVFDQSIGQVFVACIAGNIATSEIIASLEYGVAALGTKVIIVLGRRNCGAVKATIKGKGEPGQISALYPSVLCDRQDPFPTTHSGGSSLLAQLSGLLTYPKSGTLGTSGPR